MGTQRCGPEEAFELLTRASQRENGRLREIARRIVEGATGRRATGAPGTVRGRGLTRCRRGIMVVGLRTGQPFLTATGPG
jgi:hypothetical protein